MAKRGLGKGLGAFFGEEVANTKETSGEKVSRSERKEQLMGKSAEKKPENTAKNTEKIGIAGNGDAEKSSVVKDQENHKRKTWQEEKDNADSELDDARAKLDDGGQDSSDGFYFLSV